jgi:hypothetical protein
VRLPQGTLSSFFLTNCLLDQYHKRFALYFFFGCRHHSSRRRGAQSKAFPVDSMSFAIRKSKFAGVKLLVAIDVGTTFTAASYCLLDRKGNPLKLQEVGPYLLAVFQI